MDGTHRSAAARRSDQGRRHSCRPEQVLELLRRAQDGDTPAEHELHEAFAPMVQGVLARYRDDGAVHEESEGEAYLILHRLILQFDPHRGVNVFTYLERTLPQAIWTFVRRERTVARREVPHSSLRTGDIAEDPGLQSLPDEMHQELIEEGCRWLTQQSRLEEVVVARLALEEALAMLPERQRKLFEIWRDGAEVQVAAPQLNMTIQACYKALERLLSRLREVLSAHD
jgi:RNA polymerase sigma factor (sigma-70 family)